MASDSLDMKFVEGFLSDLRNISNEGRKKHTAVKEAAETAIIRLRNLTQNGKDVRQSIVSHCLDLLQPILLAAESGNNKLVVLGLQALQRLFAHETIADASLPVVMSLMWNLMENHIEELKLIQTITLIMTSSSVLHSENLAKSLVICLRMHFSKDPVVSSTAGAAIHQLVPLIFEKALEESRHAVQKMEEMCDGLEVMRVEVPLARWATAPAIRVPLPFLCHLVGPMRIAFCSGAVNILSRRWYLPYSCCVSNILVTTPLECCRKFHGSSPDRTTLDLFTLDLCQVMNGEQPTWLVGMTEMTRVLALELIEAVLLSYRPLFDLKEFSFLLKERLCPLLIKLISPCARHARSAAATPSSTPSPSAASFSEKPSFPVIVHLVRIVYVLLTQYCDVLRTESEIFYSLLIKFIDADKVHWTKLLALEVFYKLLSDVRMVTLISQTYSTKAASEGVFCDMINTINNYILTVFVKPTSPSSPSSSNAGTPQPASSPSTVSTTFSYKDVNIQLVPIGKPVIMESREAEAPVSTDNYGLSLAFSSLCFVSRTVQDTQQKITAKDSRGTKGVLQVLVQNSWCGMLSAVSTLLEASSDDSITDSLLHICKVYIQAAGTTNAEVVREAFITALCKAAFPINYTIGILKAASSRLAPYRGDMTGLDRKNNSEPASDARNRNQIVAVGTPLSSSFQGAVMLTSKNITCLSALLDITISLGDVLDGSWILVLASLQHLAWILGINQFIPGFASGLAKNKQRGTESAMNTIVTNVLMSDLPELTKRFDEVFRNTKLLSDTSLEHIVNALCKLSLDALETSATSREPSLFAIAKLVDVSLNNMFRVETWWTLVTSNLTEVSGNPNTILRDWGTDALTILAKEGLAFDFQPPLSLNMALQDKMLRPLLDLSRITWSDVRLKQYNCLNHVILSSSEKISNCWRPIMDALCGQEGLGDEALVRADFKCVQAIVSDHLRNIAFDCIEKCAEAAARFGTQTVDLNVSLSAIGVLWNIADYIYQNRTGFNVSQERVLGSMLSIYKQLSQLCLDLRPEVRKSGAQTLFLAIASHGSGLDLASWQRLIVEVCYTLLKCLEKYCLTASEDKIGEEGEDKVIIHHSRDTAKKQWAETWALVLPSVTKTVLLNLPVILKLKQPPQIWQGLLHHIHRAAVPSMEEVTMASLRCLDEILSSGEVKSDDQEPVDRKSPSLISVSMWEDVWKMYATVGVEMVDYMHKSASTDTLPSQKVLTFYSGLFRRLSSHLHGHFTPEMFKKLQEVFPQIMLPLLSKNASKILPCKAEISPLQECVLQNAEGLQKDIVKPRSPSPHLVGELFSLWLKYARFSTTKPVIAEALGMDEEYVTRWWAATFSLFSETAMQRVIELYQDTFTWKLVMESDVLSSIIQALHQPLRLRSIDARQTSWKVAIQAIFKMVRMTLPTITHQNNGSYKNVWNHLAKAFESILYGEARGLPAVWGTEDVDCEVVRFVRMEIMPRVNVIPAEDLAPVLSVLGKGSIHRNVTDADHVLPVNAEAYAMTCFEALLEFQLIHYSMYKGTESVNIPTVLLRCEKLLASLSVKSSELTVARGKNALRCIRSALMVIKQTPTANVDRQVWHDVIMLYPKLVALVPVTVTEPLTTDDAQRFPSLLASALLQYTELIQPPFKL